MATQFNAGRITFVPKGTFNYDTQYSKFDVVTYNGSSFFAKIETINEYPDSSEKWQLIAQKGKDGEPGAVKMQVVDTLPQVGDTDTIYLLKKDTPDEQNLYDEYVYTEASGWEHIGDTSVDLTDYYTKEETEEKLNNKQDALTAGNNITIENNVISASGGIPTFYIYTGKDTYSMNGFSANYTSTSDIVKSFNEFFNNIDTMNFRVQIVFDNRFTGDSGNIECYCSRHPNLTTQEFISSGSSSMTFMSPVIFLSYNKNNNNLGFKIYAYFVYDTSKNEWNSISIYTQQLPYLPIGDTNNSKVLKYTPTSDYNPATKKYVDDNANTKIGENSLVFAKSFDSATYPNASNMFYNSGCDDADVCSYFSDIFTKMYQSTPNYQHNAMGGTLILTFPGAAKNGITLCFYYYGGTFGTFIGLGRSSGNPLDLKQYKLHCDATINTDNNTITVRKATITESQITTQTPTSDTSVANKKYVDDSISSAITTTLSGSY